jgi:hypothetical protein
VTDRLSAAFAAVDEENAGDPRRVPSDDGDGALPAELVYGRRMSAWLDRLEPAASEPLRLAVRAQHIGRFAVPRSSYPEGRAGYKQWRSALARRHAAAAASIAERVGYGPEVAARVRDLVLKKGLAVDPETQLLEDVACLVFLEHYLADFAGKHERAKLIEIVQKTWKKMSERGRAAALGISLGAAERSLIEEALAAGPAPGERA